MLKIFTENKGSEIITEVKNLKEAKDCFVKFRDIFNMGASEYLLKKSGTVEDENGKFTAYISYNGRVWDSENEELKKEILIS